VPTTREKQRFLKSDEFSNLFVGSTDFATIEARIGALPEEWQRGEAFERFIEAYFRTHADMWQVDELWPVWDIPLRLQKRFNVPKNEAALDGLVKTREGRDTYFTYQAKFRRNRPKLSREELGVFLGFTEASADRVLVTNCDTEHGDVTKRQRLRIIHGNDFDVLTPDQVAQITGWLLKSPVVPVRKTLRAHQVEAVEKVTAAFTERDRATMVMACGSGKTLTSIHVAKTTGGRRILVLVPSPALVRQAVKDWAEAIPWDQSFRYLCVCSDDTVGAGDDALTLQPTDLPFKVTTDVNLVREFLTVKDERVSVVFTTYHSADVVAAAMPTRFSFDLGIFDEAHKTVGHKSGMFAFALTDTNLRIRKRLFQTATPRIVRVKKVGSIEVTSMDDATVYGPVVYRLTFGEAVKLGIIVDYKIIVSTVNAAEVDAHARKHNVTPVKGDAQAFRYVADQLAFAKAVKTVKAKRIITFHDRVKSAQRFVDDPTRGIGAFLKKFDTAHVNGSMTVADRESILRGFSGDHNVLVSNARCLTEGVDLPAVDMVAFMAPKKSVVDIQQAVGRAMRKPKDGTKAFGYVFVPVLVEDHQAGDVDSVVASCAKTTWERLLEVVSAMADADSRLDDIITQVNAAKLRGKPFNPRVLQQFVQVIGDITDLETVAKAVNVVVLGMRGDQDPDSKKVMFLQMAREGYPIPDRSTRAYYWLHNYTSPRNRCYDPVFAEQMRLAGWVCRDQSAIAAKKKAGFLQRAQSGHPKPKYGTNDYWTLGSYIQPKSDCFDAVFAEQISLTGWAVQAVSSTADKQKAAFLAMARSGQPLPKSDTPAYRRFCSYTSTSHECYDPEFTKQIQRAGWTFRDASVGVAQMKSELLRRARTGEPMPPVGSSDYNCLQNYCNPKRKSCDPVFRKRIQRAGWKFRDQSAEAAQKKALLLKMARAGKPKPQSQSKESGWFHMYINPNSGCYDPVFTEQIAAAGWSTARVDRRALAGDKKAVLLKLACAGRPMPPVKTKENGWIWRYTRVQSDSFDVEFTRTLVDVAPHWFSAARLIDLKAYFKEHRTTK
jgi:superfamily II DNA or RNA helicase